MHTAMLNMLIFHIYIYIYICIYPQISLQILCVPVSALQYLIEIDGSVYQKQSYRLTAKQLGGVGS